MDQEQVRQKLNVSREQLLSLIEDLPEEAFHEPGVMDDWTLKDIIAHISRWEGLCVTMLWQLKQDKKAERLSIHGQQAVDRYNAQWHQEDKDRALDLIMADFKGLRKQTIRRLADFSREELTDPESFEGLRNQPLWKWIAVDTYEHEREHMEAISEWLHRRG